MQEYVYNKQNLSALWYIGPPRQRSLSSTAQFWRTQERLCMNRERSLLSMRYLFLGAVSNPGLIAARLPLFGTAGSVITIGFINKRMLALEKALWGEKTRLTCPEVRASATSKGWRVSGLASPRSRRQRQLLLGWWYKGDVTRDDSQRRVLAQHSFATLFWMATILFQHCNEGLR